MVACRSSETRPWARFSLTVVAACLLMNDGVGEGPPVHDDLSRQNENCHPDLMHERGTHVDE